MPHVRSVAERYEAGRDARQHTKRSLHAFVGNVDRDPVELRDMKVSAEVERMNSTILQGYARICAWALARAHAKASGQAVEIAAYLGSGGRFGDALVEYAFAYARQNQKDYDAFMRACRTGKLEARSDEDMAADFRV